MTIIDTVKKNIVPISLGGIAGYALLSILNKNKFALEASLDPNMSTIAFQPDDLTSGLNASSTSFTPSAPNPMVGMPDTGIPGVVGTPPSYYPYPIEGPEPGGFPFPINEYDPYGFGGFEGSGFGQPAVFLPEIEGPEIEGGFGFRGEYYQPVDIPPWGEDEDEDEDEFPFRRRHRHRRHREHEGGIPDFVEDLLEGIGGRRGHRHRGDEDDDEDEGRRHRRHPRGCHEVCDRDDDYDANECHRCKRRHRDDDDDDRGFLGGLLGGLGGVDHDRRFGDRNGILGLGGLGLGGLFGGGDHDRDDWRHRELNGDHDFFRGIDRDKREFRENRGGFLGGLFGGLGGDPDAPRDHDEMNSRLRRRTEQHRDDRRMHHKHFGKHRGRGRGRGRHLGWR